MEKLTLIHYLQTPPHQTKTLTDIEALDFIEETGLQSYMLYTVIDSVTGEYYLHLKY